MRTIIPQTEGKCFLCGANATEVHHIIYGNGRRAISDRFGLTVQLCRTCHNTVHNDHDIDLELKKVAQRIAMRTYGWTTEDFREKFYKNYL